MYNDRNKIVIFGNNFGEKWLEFIGNKLKNYF